MRSLVPLVFVALSTVSAAPVELLHEDFDSDLGVFQDLSKAVIWTGAPADGSCFEVNGSALQLNAEAFTTSRFGPGSLLSFSAIDFQFPKAVAHATNTVTIEYRLRFEVVGQRGESNRTAVMLLHDYPEGGLDLTPGAKVSDFTEEWFARPAYQARIRGGFNPPDAAPYLMYGGGLTADGEFETQNDSGGNPLFWLPGFVSSAGGTSPGQTPADNFPEEGYVMATSAPASETYKRYRFIVEPDTMRLEVNNADDGVLYETVMEMPLPIESEAPTNPAPPLYRYFEEFEGIRITYGGFGGQAGRDNMFLDYVKVTVDGDFALSRPESISSIAVSGGNVALTIDDSDVTRRYRIEGNTDLSLPFEPIPGQTSDGNGGTLNFNIPASGTQEFFKASSEEK